MTEYEELDAIYAELPTVNCQRKCQGCCGPILIPKIEARRLEERRGMLQVETGILGARRADLPPPEIVKRDFVGLVPDRNLDCVFLAPFPFGGCMAYKIRPLICRVWGCIDQLLLRCPFGCEPTRWITPEEHKQVIMKVLSVQARTERVAEKAVLAAIRIGEQERAHD